MTIDTLFIQTFVDGIILGLIYALAAVGLSLSFGVMHVINVAHGEFIILGALLTYIVWTSLGLSPIYSILLIIAVNGLIGFLLQYFVVNRLLTGPPLASLVFFFGLAIALPNVYIILWGPFSRSVTDPLLSRSVSIYFINISLAKIVSSVLSILSLSIVLYLLYKTRFGIGIRAAVQNRDAAMILGINIYRLYAYVFSLSLILAGVAGYAIATTMAFTPVQGPIYTLLTFLIVVLGGMGYVIGSIVAALLIGLAQTFIATYLSSLYVYAFAFLLLYMILLISPKGILRRGI
jgi:branched-chain amino acid transport system permease protein